MAITKLELPTILAYKKAYEITEGEIENELQSDIIINTAVMGFNDIEEKNNSNNIITHERCYLKKDENELKIKYLIQINGINETPFKINKKNILIKLKSFQNFLLKDDFITTKYAEGMTYNMLIGLFADRNRINATNIKTKIDISIIDENQIINKKFDFKDINFRLFRESPFEQKLDQKSNVDKMKEKLPNFSELVKIIKNALINKEFNFIEIKVENIFKLNNGALIYPSQLFIEGNKSAKIISNRYNGLKITKPENTTLYYKTLASNLTKYGFTPEKIGNALRRFDTFYSDKEFFGAIPFEPNGSSQQLQENLRKTKNNIFSILKNILNIDDYNEISNEDKLFVFAMFVRGGLFNDTKK